MVFSHFSTVTLVTATLFSLPVRGQLYDKVIQTSYGPVQGFQYFNQSTLEQYFNVSSSNVAAFLGIRYAADTSYQNRWKAPQPRDPWNQTFIADSFGPPCPIWTNANASTDNLPVMVWNQGSDETSNAAMWYGGGMALKDVVIVTFNRRDDALGFLAHPDLNAESLVENGHNASGHYGVLDHLAVLKWVNKNIANFGGNPERVTIAGQSFGSSQVYHAVNSELFKGYFVRAIAESGIRYPYDTLVAGLATSYVDMTTALTNGMDYTLAHNVSTIAELRNLSIASLLIGSQDRATNSSYSWITALSTGYPLLFKPVLDGYVLPKKYIETLLEGPPNDVPLITGNTKDESGAATTTNLTVSEYIADCTANDWVKSASSPIYTYYWTHAPPGQDQGAYHQSEIFYALNSLYASADICPWTDYDYYVGEVMSSYWANFCKTGNPNLGGSGKYKNLTHWTSNDGVSPTVFQLGNAWGNYKIAHPAQVSLISAYFAQQTPF
ncbi:Carboxylesterase type B protein [Rutstroemia sp. NJR-2017a BBW]|nr:Carboxylesterase type B protein [Rutstroemia sp. NJR-2017a BBW]